MKICKVCGIEKPFENFVKRNNRKNGYQPYCKECHNDKVRKEYKEGDMRDYDLMKAYGITQDDYNGILEFQNYRCAICKGTVEEKMKGNKKHLCVDHDHKTGKVRGLLCDPCNRAIGLLEDHYAVLQNAYRYLSVHTENFVEIIHL
jgi:hypothetical protein